MFPRHFIARHSFRLRSVMACLTGTGQPSSRLRPSSTFGGGNIRTLIYSSQYNNSEKLEALVPIVPPIDSPPGEIIGAPKKLSKIDMERYIYPLLCHGWKLNSGSDKSLVLQRSLVFKGPISARKFLVKLLDTEEKIWHHANSIHLNGEKRPTLTLSVQTHDLTPTWISLRDVRLAAALESAYREGEFAPDKGKSAVQSPAPLPTESWAKLLQSYPWEKDGVSIVDNTYE